MTRRLLLQALGAAPTVFGQTALEALELGCKYLLPIDLGGRVIHLFQNGFLPVVERDLRSITVIDVTGGIAASFQVSIPEAAVTAVGAVAVSSEKTVVAAVSAKAADGRYASLLTFADFTGKPKRIVRTTPFAAGRLVFLPDGRLLCIGREYDDRYGLFEDVEGHSILRFYSAGGVLEGKALSVDRLRADKRELHPLDWLVAPGKDRIGLLDRESMRYIEFDHAGTVIRSLAPLGIDPPARVSGIALLSNGDRIVSVEFPIHSGAESAFGLLQLTDTPDKGVARRSVTEIVPPEGFLGLDVLGIRGGDLVLRTNPAGALMLFPQPIT